MEIIGYGKKVTKTVWTDIARKSKMGWIIAIVPIKILNKDDSFDSVKIGVVKLTHDEAPMGYSELDKIEQLLVVREKGKHVNVGEEVVYITRQDYMAIAKATGGTSLATVAPYIEEKYAPRVQELYAKYYLVTEEGILGIIGDITKKVSRKIARDTYRVSYAQYIDGEMRLENVSLQKSHPTGKAYEHSVCLGVEVIGKSIVIAIMARDDTEGGVESGETYDVQHIPIDRLPIIQFKQGKYFGEAYKVILDVVLKAMLLASTEGYKEYALKNGTPYRGEAFKYSWLTLKNGTKIQWDGYNLETLVGYLK